MSESPETRTPITPPDVASAQKGKPDKTLGRILFLVAGGVLLATMVSCACGPVR